MRKWLIPVILCVLAASVPAVQAGRGGEASAAPLKTVAVKRADITPRIVTSGNLSVRHQVDLNFGVVGVLKAINVSRGDRVTKGQPLAQLDDGSAQDAVRRQTLQLQSDQLTTDLAQLDYKQAQDLVDQASPRPELRYTLYPDMVSVQSNIQLATNSLQTYIDAVRAGGDPLTTPGLPTAQNFLNTALNAASVTQYIPIDKGKSVSDAITAWGQLTYARDKAKLTADKAKVGLEMSKFNLELANKDLAKTTLTAPFDGVISDVSLLDQGSSVTTATKVIHLVDASQVEMTSLMLQLDIAGIKVGQSATVTLDAMPGTALKGKVTFVSPTATVTSGVVAYPITVTLDPIADLGPRDGMTATATIAIDPRSNVLVVPLTALSGNSSQRTVQVVVDQSAGKTEVRPVTVGASDTGNVEIVSGLKEGELVVVP